MLQLETNGDCAGLHVCLPYYFSWDLECVSKADSLIIPAHHPAHTGGSLCTQEGSLWAVTDWMMHTRSTAHDSPLQQQRNIQSVGPNQSRYKDKHLKHVQGRHQILTSRCFALQLQPGGHT